MTLLVETLTLLVVSWDYWVNLGTVGFYLKFFLFALREKGGEGVEGSENMKLEEKPEENEQWGGGLVN